MKNLVPRDLYTVFQLACHGLSYEEFIVQEISILYSNWHAVDIVYKQ